MWAAAGCYIWVAATEDDGEARRKVLDDVKELLLGGVDDDANVLEDFRWTSSSSGMLLWQ